MERVLIGVAWPYANGPLHLGHVAGSLLAPDVFARFHRMRGDQVLMVSGSDEHGTPITVTADKEGLAPQAIVDRYHEQHKKVLADLGISFDLFTRTSSAHHREWVHDIFRGLKARGYIDEREMSAPYDPKAQRFLPDRYVEGECPHCNFKDARGDQCDSCGKTLDASELIHARSKLNPETRIEFRPTTHAFFKLSAFEGRLRAYVKDKGHWRPNTKNFTENWLAEGLQDRAVTRDIAWGIPWPDGGGAYRDKRIYVWFEAVCGYLTASVLWAKEQGRPDAWKPFWEVDHDGIRTRSYYFLAKDNIPFHTIIWPAILMGYSDHRETKGLARLHLPHDVPSNEYLNLSGQQFSKSRGVGIWVHEVLQHFEPDAIRYYLAVNMPEGRDADWTWDDFLSKVNDELVAAYGNFVHRSMSLAHKHFGKVPEARSEGPAEAALLAKLRETHQLVAAQLEAAKFKQPIKDILALAREGNRYIDAQAPWKLATADQERLAVVLHHAMRLCRALAILTAPYLPYSAERLWTALGEEGSVHQVPWDDALADIAGGRPIGPPKPLFAKLDPVAVKRLVGGGAASPPSHAPLGKAVGGATAGVARPLVTIEDFQKLEIKVGKVVSVEDHPKADKLYVVKVDLGGGDVRQLVAGLRGAVKRDELVGRRVVVLANLQPAVLRGVESHGMLLAAEGGGVIAPLTTEMDLPPGAKVR